MQTWNVVGEAAPKGSGRAMLVGGRAQYVPAGSPTNGRKLHSWRHEVIAAVQARPCDRFEGPLACALLFTCPLRRGDLTPRGLPKAHAPAFSSVKPDVDKLVRATLDALTDAGVWLDDAQVAFPMTPKMYAPPGHPPGCWIAVDIVERYLEVFRALAERMAALQGELDWARVQKRRPTGNGQRRLAL